MNQESGFPEQLLPSNIFTLKRPPVLWIGSGISKRYVSGFPTWDELLSRVAGQFGVDEDMYAGIRLEIIENLEDPRTPNDVIAMKVASKLTSMLYEKIIS